MKVLVLMEKNATVLKNLMEQHVVVVLMGIMIIQNATVLKHNFYNHNNLSQELKPAYFS